MTNTANLEPYEGRLQNTITYVSWCVAFSLYQGIFFQRFEKALTLELSHNCFMRGIFKTNNI